MKSGHKTGYIAKPTIPSPIHYQRFSLSTVLTLYKYIFFYIWSVYILQNSPAVNGVGIVYLREGSNVYFWKQTEKKNAEKH